MKNLIISIVCLLILIVPWWFYNNYSVDTVQNYKHLIDDQIIPSIEMGDWQRAEKNFDIIAEDWDKFKTTSAYFIDTTAVNEVDCFVSKAYYYIKMQDASNAAAEVAYLKYRFDFLHENEMPSLGNVF